MTMWSEDIEEKATRALIVSVTGNYRANARAVLAAIQDDVALRGDLDAEIALAKSWKAGNDEALRVARDLADALKALGAVGLHARGVRAEKARAALAAFDALEKP